MQKKNYIIHRAFHKKEHDVIEMSEMISYLIVEDKF